MTLFESDRNVQYTVSNTFVTIKTRGTASSRSSSCPPSLSEEDVPLSQFGSPRNSKMAADVDNFLVPPLTAHLLERHTSTSLEMQWNAESPQPESPTEATDVDSSAPGELMVERCPPLTATLLDRHVSAISDAHSPIPDTAQPVPGTNSSNFFSNIFSTNENPAPAPSKAGEMTPLDKAETLTDTSLVGDAAMSKMRYETQAAGLSKSQWTRVVHSGYGNDLWRDALRASDMDVVVGSSHPEGVYVRIPEKGTVDSVVTELQAINAVVRKKTTFPEMKRANKSRLQFKNSIIIYASEGSTRSTADTERSGSQRSGRSRTTEARTGYLEQFLHAPGFKDGYMEQQVDLESLMKRTPPRYHQPKPEPNSQFPMMFAAQPTPGNGMAPIYMCVGMMPAQM
jgi:hypothetical protein